MKNRSLKLVTVMAIALLIFSGCAKVPQMEIDNAKAAIEAVRASGVEVYVADAFGALNDSMNVALESITAKNSKMFKNFKNETAQLVAVVSQAAAVQAAGDEKISQLKAEIEKIVGAITTKIEESKNLVLQAPKGKEGNTALMAIKADIASVETSLDELKTVVGTENYIQSLNKIKAVDTQISSIKSELETVIEKFKSKTKK
ncbi:MAG TPA: hypothetical protein VJY41_05480 [Prolixibacteraceae bacterium]|nr:hypothetical protein [Prolixibacteraceae bacterium]